LDFLPIPQLLHSRRYPIFYREVKKILLKDYPWLHQHIYSTDLNSFCIGNIRVETPEMVRSHRYHWAPIGFKKSEKERGSTGFTRHHLSLGGAEAEVVALQ